MDLMVFLFYYLFNLLLFGVDGSVSMIVELVVGIVVNLLLESCDVVIIYLLLELFI